MVFGLIDAEQLLNNFLPNTRWCGLEMGSRMNREIPSTSLSRSASQEEFPAFRRNLPLPHKNFARDSLSFADLSPIHSSHPSFLPGVSRNEVHKMMSSYQPTKHIEFAYLLPMTDSKEEAGKLKKEIYRK